MDAAAQIETLEGAFLSSIETEFPDPLTERERANLHAYLVLAHSVLEEEIESAFEEYFNQVAATMNGDMVPKAAVLLTYAVRDRVAEKAQVAYKTRDVLQFVQGKGRTVIESAINSNNGIKTNNVKSLAEAVGIHWTLFEQTVSTALLDLDTLGTKRGSSSHLSPFSPKTTSITSSFDPDDVRKWVQDGVAASSAIRTHLTECVTTPHPPPQGSPSRQLRGRAPKLRLPRALRR